MYPEITHLVRRAIQRRYEIIPYIYGLALKSHTTAEPPQRWIGWGYENDPEVWTKYLKNGENQFWMGDALLIGGVYEEDVNSAKMYLPKKDDNDLGYFNLNAPYQHLEAGQWVDIASHWKDSIPVLAKVGAAIPVGKNVQTLSPGEGSNPADLPADDYRGLELFPPKWNSSGENRTYKCTWLEDDGIAASPQIVEFTVSFKCLSEEEIQFEWSSDSSKWTPHWKELYVILPVGDDRKVVSANGKAYETADERMKQDEKQRKIYRC